MNAKQTTVKSILTDQQGFTLLETMVAMMIFLVGITSILFLEVSAINDHTRARDSAGEIHFTVMQTEMLMAPLPWNSNRLAPGAPRSNFLVGYTGSLIQEPANFGTGAEFLVTDDNLVRGTKTLVVRGLNRPDRRRLALTSVKPSITR